MKKIKYEALVNEFIPPLCQICGDEIVHGDECYCHGEGVHTCSLKCAKKFEGDEDAKSI